MRYRNKVKHTRSEMVRNGLSGEARRFVLDVLRPTAGGWSFHASTAPSGVSAGLVVHGLENVTVRESHHSGEDQDDFTVTKVAFDAGGTKVEIGFFGFTFADVLARFVAAQDLGAVEGDA